jgi:hypothetical protein
MILNSEEKRCILPKLLLKTTIFKIAPSTEIWHQHPRPTAWWVNWEGSRSDVHWTHLSSMECMTCTIKPIDESDVHWFSPHPELIETISPAELKKLRRCGSFDLSGPIIYQRLWFNSNKQSRASKFVFRLPHSRCDFLEPLWFPCGDLRTENIRRHCSPELIGPTLLLRSNKRKEKEKWPDDKAKKE